MRERPLTVDRAGHITLLLCIEMQLWVRNTDSPSSHPVYSRESHSALAASGDTVNLANSRGAETLRTLAASIGVRAESATGAVRDIEVVIDTGNYHPKRGGQIEPLDEGQAEALWISEQLGGPVAKAWNAALAQTIAEGGRPAGSPGRSAPPVAGDDAHARQVAATLTDNTGFDPAAGPDLRRRGKIMLCGNLLQLKLPNGVK